MNDSDFSIFLHEYIHFIQDVTTFYGFNNINAIAEYMRYANNFIIRNSEKVFEVPISPDPDGNDFVFLNDYICSLTYGDVEQIPLKKVKNYHLNKILIPFENSPIKEIETVDVTFVSDNGDEGVFSFGAGCVMENMAYLFEKLTCVSYKQSPNFPYNAAELLADNIFPEFAKNKLNILALCDISLGVSNPAKYFVKTLEEWKLKNAVPNSPEILYREFANKDFIVKGNNPNGLKTLNDFGEVIKLQLTGYFNAPYFSKLNRWIETVINTAISIRQSQPTFIIDIAKGNIRENILFKQIFNKIGTPLLTNDNDEFRFYHPNAYTEQIDIGYFWAISQIHECFFLGKITPCELQEFCKNPKSKTIIDKRCKTAPWSRSNDDFLCPFAAIWKHWGLTNFIPSMSISS